ncbi:vascular endothelial growth factor receptor 1-like isoform X2 [Planococcus citri]|uniref:vascular endothelial growth factor receptor 1-like isoform X2 n=1 Tax=Planococcus citri TaxID=170843 RepID=UPI0031F7F4E1
MLLDARVNFNNMANKLPMPLFVLAFLQFAHCISGVKIFPNVTELVIGKNETLSLNCSNNKPIIWSYQRGELGRRYGSFTSFSSEKIVMQYRSVSYSYEDEEITDYENKTINSWTENGTYFNTLTINPGLHLETGNYICQEEKNAFNVAHTYVYVYDEKKVLDPSDTITHAYMFETAVIPCKPCSPNISVSLTRNYIDVVPIEKYDPKIGYVISTYPIIDLYTYFSCTNSKTGLQQIYTLMMHPPQNDSSDPYIEVNASHSNHAAVFENQTVVLNCSVIASSDVGINSLEWQFPRNVSKKISIGSISEITHKKFDTYFRILSIPNLSEYDEGNYSCIVNDGNFKTKVRTHLLSLADPREVFLNITAPEESRVVTGLAGKSAEFKATIQSSPQHKIIWYDPQGNTIDINSSHYEGTEKGHEIKLKISGLTFENAGIYRLDVANKKLNKTINFRLIVEDKPQVILKGIDWYYRGFRLFKVNTTYEFKCMITGFPPPQIEWSVRICHDYCISKPVGTFKKIPVSMHEEKPIEAHKTISTLYFKSNQSAIIRCQANNSLGDSDALFEFLVTDYDNSTAVIIKNHSALITVGDDVEIICAVPKYYFYNTFEWVYYAKNSTQNTQRIAINPSAEIQIQNYTTNFSYVSNLIINNVQKNHDGIYLCKTNLSRPRSGNYFVRSLRTDSDSVNLTVIDPKAPLIIHSMMKNGALQVYPKTQVHLLIQVNGIPSPFIVWYKDEKPISFNHRITLSNDRQNLTIADASYEDEGEYSFIASNKAGNVTDRLHLSIRGAEGSSYFGLIILISLSLIGFVILYLIRRSYNHKKKLQKVLEEYGLDEREESTVTTLDPNVDIQDQTFFISYNKKYEFPREKLKLGEVLGSGAFGVVKKAVADGIEIKGVKTTVAAKMAKLQDPSCTKALSSEMKIMIYLGNHINVVNLIGACTKELINGELIVIVEYCQFGNIHSYLLKRRSQFTNQVNKNDEIDFSITAANKHYENVASFGEAETVKKSTPEQDTPIIDSDKQLIAPEDNVPIKTMDLVCWSYQVASGMEFLASHKILHRDLAARNVLLGNNRIAKICDFGLAKNMYYEEKYQSSNKTQVLPMRWMPIESIRDGVFSSQSDVWAFGITMWEFFSLAATPYPGLENSEVYEKLLSGYRLEKPKFATSKIYDIMKDCWKKYPKQRPSFNKLVQKLGDIVEPPTESQNPESNHKSNDPTKDCAMILNAPVAKNPEAEIELIDFSKSL